MSINLLSLIKDYPQIYVFEDRHEPGWLKVGYTVRQNAEDRVREQFNTRLQLDNDPYILHHVEDAVDVYDVPFMDHDVHAVLVNKGIKKKGEFFLTDLNTVKSAILSVKRREIEIENRHQTFSMRTEQAKAVELTKAYFEDSLKRYPNNKPKFLWNAKMRFGKTFGAYQLAKSMGLKKVLVLTYKPAVEHSWREDLLSHIDFIGWQFISRRQDNLDSLDNTKPLVYFASFQDILGLQDDGEIKKHNEWIHKEEWDMIIQDEYHFGAWRDNVKELLDSDNESELLGPEDETMNSINGKCFLYLSGTPFRAIQSGEFADNQVFNWTYADEQNAKANFEGEDNPYASLPEMNILTYQLPQQLKNVASRGEYDEFNLSYFFKASGEYESAKFINEGEVQKWLDLIEGKTDTEDDIVRDLKLRKENIQFPFSKNTSLYKSLNHMIWLLPNVASCCAMEKLLKEEHNKFYKDFEIIVAAGSRGGSGAEALIPLEEAIGDNPLKSKTITLTCGKLTTGVTVKSWTGIFMLRALRSPESYFQSAFRVQSPWVIHKDGEESVIQKHQCFVFDFDPNRALSQIATYASKLDTRDVNPEIKIAEFIKFLPILAYDGFGMEAIDAAGLLDISIGQTTSTLLAKGWNNALLVNVDNPTLTNMVNSAEAMRIINSIESFRRVSDGKVDDTIINHTKNIKTLKTKRATDEGLTSKEKKELTYEERNYNKKRQLIREKLQTLATRIPLFMYMTDYREETLSDIIMKLEPELFKKVTGLTIVDFELLVDLGLFNSELMNNVVYKFRKYEDASMSYSGIDRRKGEIIAGFDEVKKNR
ncbi:MAG TPA: GIY-YIG nuclease family protein [Clostridiales bacterium]|nr:GIY-YIG nuclease family protein [Clostridiales bacterium]